ncbi:hypothetical protein PHMEG_00027900 [Phytophthora megakarya]|uniref:Uncharacterized protein n=1 Tax=Phytophthora megakarya TaxID=4795 RepID=A0A225V781_9STRA|nr:hypothetical protein PHMEG_00027900 [Phytophthora megakarya]
MSASNDTNYTDAALVVMLWYIYGRSSDAEQVEKKTSICLARFAKWTGLISSLQTGQNWRAARNFLIQGSYKLFDVSSLLLSGLTRHVIDAEQTNVPLIPTKNTKLRHPQDLEELSLVELLEADDIVAAQETSGPQPKRSVPGAQAYVNRLLVRVMENSKLQNVRLTPKHTSHSFRRGGAMHANDGTVAENWIIERGGWQQDRVKKAFEYMLGMTQADQQVSRALSQGQHTFAIARSTRTAGVHPRSKAPEPPLANTMLSDDETLNLDEDVADVLLATLLMHFPDVLHLSERCPLIEKIQMCGEANRSFADHRVFKTTGTRAFRESSLRIMIGQLYSPRPTDRSLLGPSEPSAILI